MKITVDRFDEVRRDIHRALEGVLEDLADDVVKDARKRAPVSTGHLRDSIKAQKR